MILRGFSFPYATISTSCGKNKLLYTKYFHQKTDAKEICNENLIQKYISPKFCCFAILKFEYKQNTSLAEI
jgi:hypothetical protein